MTTAMALHKHETVDEQIARENRAMMLHLYVTPAPPRPVYYHEFNPITNVCRRCTLTLRQHKSVPNGMPCDLALYVER